VLGLDFFQEIVGLGILELGGIRMISAYQVYDIHANSAF
jgi:hypothetical protein